MATLATTAAGPAEVAAVSVGQRSPPTELCRVLCGAEGVSVHRTEPEQTDHSLPCRGLGANRFMSVYHPSVTDRGFIDLRSTGLWRGQKGIPEIMRTYLSAQETGFF